MGHMGKNLCDLQAGWDIFSRTLAMITFPAEKRHDHICWQQVARCPRSDLEHAGSDAVPRRLAKLQTPRSPAHLAGHTCAAWTRVRALVSVID